MEAESPETGRRRVLRQEGRVSRDRVVEGLETGQKGGDSREREVESLETWRQGVLRQGGGES